MFLLMQEFISPAYQGSSNRIIPQPGRAGLEFLVINLSISETLELQDCRKTLQCTLKRLDALGAGIAAIHVNAAIEQLTSNLETIGQSHSDDADLVALVDRETPEIMH